MAGMARRNNDGFIHGKWLMTRCRTWSATGKAGKLAFKLCLAIQQLGPVCLETARYCGHLRCASAHGDPW